MVQLIIDGFVTSKVLEAYELHGLKIPMFETKYFNFGNDIVPNAYKNFQSFSWFI